MINKLLSGSPWISALMIILAVIIVGVGGSVVVINELQGDGGYTFRQYLDDLKWFALAVAGSGLGKALFEYAKRKSSDSTAIAKTGTVVANVTEAPKPKKRKKATK